MKTKLKILALEFKWENYRFILNYPELTKITINHLLVNGMTLNSMDAFSRNVTDGVLPTKLPLNKRLLFLIPLFYVQIKSLIVLKRHRESLKK